MDDLLQPLIALIGVIVGGGISYFAQTSNQRKIEKRNDLRQKHIAYNKFLLSVGEKNPLIIPVHHNERVGFDWSLYNAFTRKILYENLHLFNSKIVDRVLKIDLKGEEADVMGLDYEHIKAIYYWYSEIIDYIKADYNNDLK